MKKIIYIFIVFALLVVPAWGQSATVDPTNDPSPTVKTPTPTDKLGDEVDKLKERVAEKVSELKQGEDEVTAGIITKIDKETLLLKDDTGDEVEVALDETLTTYYQVLPTTFREGKKADLVVNDYVFVIGPEINGVITANEIYEDTRYLVLSGKITNVNSTDFTVQIISLDKTSYTLDVQTSTKQQMLNIKSIELEQIGFSKLKEGDSIHAVIKAKADTKSTRYDAERILIIPNEYFLQ